MDFFVYFWSIISHKKISVMRTFICAPIKTTASFIYYVVGELSPTGDGEIEHFGADDGSMDYNSAASGLPPYCYKIRPTWGHETPLAKRLKKTLNIQGYTGKFSIQLLTGWGQSVHTFQA